MLLSAFLSGVGVGVVAVAWVSSPSGHVMMVAAIIIIVMMVFLLNLTLISM